MISKEQIDFFHTFGYLKLAGLFRPELDTITAEFESVFPMFGKSEGRRFIVPFIDQNDYLAGLLDDPRVDSICTALLGDDFNYMGSDGNFYVGDTQWHPDGNTDKRLHIKLAFSLDKLDGSNGALRVIPGSHRLSDTFTQELWAKVRTSEEAWGIAGSEVPAQVIDVEPGDLVLFNHNTWHSSWNGGTKRRMFTLNLSERYKEEDLEELASYTLGHTHYRRPHYYGPAMLRGGAAGRMKHLEQVISVEGDFYERSRHLPELVLV